MENHNNLPSEKLDLVMDGLTHNLTGGESTLSESNDAQINLGSSQSSTAIHPSTSDIGDCSSDSTLSDPPSFLNTPVFGQLQLDFSDLEAKDIDGLVELGPSVYEIPDFIVPPKRKILESETTLVSKKVRPNDDDREQEMHGVEVSEESQGSRNSGYIKLETSLKSPEAEESLPSFSTSQGTPGNFGSLDSRIEKHALIWDDGLGIYMVPKSCKPCVLARQFCTKGAPCSRCVERGLTCVREDGLVPAKPRSIRGAMVRRTKDEIAKAESEIQMSLTVQTSEEEPKTRRSRIGANKGSSKNPDLEFLPEVKPVPKTKRVPKVVPAMEKIRNIHEGKPEPIGLPEVWADKRQELCETLPYYRAYQSGAYAHDGLVYGYLVDGSGSPRDYMDERIVISHAGGKSELNESGKRTLKIDQLLTDVKVKSFINNFHKNIPLVIILGAGCVKSPTKPPHNYSIMGWFKVTHYWPEKCPINGAIRVMFRFEKFDSNTNGWWAASAENTSPRKDYNEDVTLATCISCRKEFFQIYKETWMCLEKNCSRFWKISNGNEPTPESLTYDESFLKAHTYWAKQYEIPPCALNPPLCDERDEWFEDNTTARASWKGMCCPKCGKCNSRTLWKGWKCTNCKFEHNPKNRCILDARRLADPHRPVFTGPPLPKNKHTSDIRWTRTVLDSMSGLSIIQYELGTCGTVTHILVNSLLNAQENSADDLLKQYQAVDIPFVRGKLHHNGGDGYTSHFALNSGVPYKYIVDQPTLSFEESPAVVRHAKKLIDERVSLIYDDVNFNEILSVGYFESCKMDFHDDGEVGLSETVASISLGCPAKMKFRIKSKYLNSPEALEGLNVTSEFLDSKDSNVRVKLELSLHHGDIMIMHGAKIQKYWEHAVAPEGRFRVAATARSISEENYMTKHRFNQITVKTEESSGPAAILESLQAVPELIPPRSSTIRTLQTVPDLIEPLSSTVEPFNGEALQTGLVPSAEVQMRYPSPERPPNGVQPSLEIVQEFDNIQINPTTDFQQ
ncbi:hypothetical protein EDC01DRAFT_97726 [Geopyxis carbonaria]|nr:hypothetical protein EDC01DRAFT_97726 [Geopyxis carbonaria]